MKELELKKLYEETENSTVDYFMSKINSNAKINIDYENYLNDIEWIDVVELTLPYIDNILRSPNRFIVNEEEIVKIELARKITVDSIKHLSKHTNLIQEVDENDDINIQYADLIKNIQDMYKQLDKEKVYNKISEYINDNSTIYDVFKFANSFKPYVRDIAIENIPTIMPEEIDELIIDFDRFVKTPNIQIINNILIQETKNISLIIKDRYALLKFNITKEDVQEDNIDTLYQILKKLKFDINLEKANMDINKISEIIELYEIIK